MDSLYEYAGTGLTRPELVGVDNEGKQISQCGTDLGWGRDLGGQGESERYNAVSAGGEKVFFTAEPGGCTGLNGKGRKKRVKALSSKIYMRGSIERKPSISPSLWNFSADCARRACRK